MPATSNNTLIKLMRGNTDSSEAWRPEVGEPLLDMESTTLNYGDGRTLGGVPINTVTCRVMETPAYANEFLTWGRYYFDGYLFDIPDEVESNGKFFLTVQTADLGTPEIWQTLQVLQGSKQLNTYNRVSLDKGISWTDWKLQGGGSNLDISGFVSNPPSDGNYYVRNGNKWVNISTLGYISSLPSMSNYVSEAPKDGKKYVRQNGLWVEATTATTEIPWTTYERSKITTDGKTFYASLEDLEIPITKDNYISLFIRPKMFISFFDVNDDSLVIGVPTAEYTYTTDQPVSFMMCAIKKATQSFTTCICRISRLGLVVESKSIPVLMFTFETSDFNINFSHNSNFSSAMYMEIEQPSTHKRVIYST